MRDDVVAVVPAYEAAGTIAAVVAGVRRHLAQVVVVDDGSTDGTGARARGAGAEVVVHPANRGKGAAILSGLEWAAARGAARVVTLDADGQHPPAEIPRLLAASDAAPGAIVVGVRQKAGQEIHWLNLLGNWVADTLLAWIAGAALPDTQSGFRVYPVAATLALGVRGTRFDFETEVLLRAARAGLAIVGVPVRVHYPPIAERTSHFDPVTDTWRIVLAGAALLAEDVAGWAGGARPDA